jgi:hypothetical protein
MSNSSEIYCKFCHKRIAEYIHCENCQEMRHCVHSVIVIGVIPKCYCSCFHCHRRHGQRIETNNLFPDSTTTTTTTTTDE